MKLDRDYIKEKAREVNIDMIGFTDGGPLLNLESYLMERKALGYECEFEEQDLERRIYPSLSLEGCKSIILIGIPYKVDFNEEEGKDCKGRLSKSSWGRDYHYVLRERMEALVQEMKRVKDFSYKIFVDTGPLIERELARKAGLGYYGKNCSIINRDYGSFIFLGHILTDLDIKPDGENLEDGCGDCDLCLRACPTGALEEAYRLNPKKCISYLTQTKNLISGDLRNKMGAQVYGCDICQDICPKNRGVKASKELDFYPSKTKGLVDIEELLFMSNREFKEKYGDISGAWRGKNILIRNSIIALGNSGDKRSIDLLERCGERHKNWDLYIQWAINKINSDG